MARLIAGARLLAQVYQAGAPCGHLHLPELELRKPWVAEHGVQRLEFRVKGIMFRALGLGIRV
jgi:hypothetical protein